MTRAFSDVSRDVGLDRPIPVISANFGDIDNDGFLDLYFGTGSMCYSGLVPNVMLRNRGGTRFEDVTAATGTGQFLPGHSVSFGDWNDDGNLDLVVTSGGGSPGDRGEPALYQNASQGNHRLTVTLVGTKTNRSAFGARIRVELKRSDGPGQSINRMIGAGGGSSRVETIGLGDAQSVERLEVYWPVSRMRQTFRDIAADQSIEITEGAGTFRVVTGHRPPER